MRTRGALATSRAVLLALVLALAWLPARAAPEAELWERWRAHDPHSAGSIDHGAWQAFLHGYVARYEDGVNRVDYAHVTAQDKARLERYVERLEATPISTYPRAEQLAFWVNLYNALTVELVLDHTPVDSIRDINISPGLFSIGPWGKKLAVIEGEEVSLDDIEHRILRPIWNDPRIHYALNCAAVGCPNLPPTAFTAAHAEGLLDQAARDYINDRRGVEIKDGKLIASKIYEWYEEDFGGSDEAVIEHLREYAEPGLATRLARFGAIDATRYDWSLNAADARFEEMKRRAAGVTPPP